MLLSNWEKKIIVRLVRMDLQLNMLYRYVQNELNGRLVVLYGPNHSRVDPWPQHAHHAHSDSSVKINFFHGCSYEQSPEKEGAGILSQNV